MPSEANAPFDSRDLSKSICPSEEFRMHPQVQHEMRDPSKWAISPDAVKEYVMQWGHLEPSNSIDQPFVQVHPESGAMRCRLCATNWTTEKWAIKRHVENKQEYSDEVGLHIESPHILAFNDLVFFRKEYLGPVLVHRLDHIHHYIENMEGSVALETPGLPQSTARLLNFGLELLFCDPTPKAQRWFEMMEETLKEFFHAEGVQNRDADIEPLVGYSNQRFFLRDLNNQDDFVEHLPAVKNYLIEHCHRLPPLYVADETDEPFIQWDESYDYWRCVICPTQWNTRNQVHDHMFEGHHRAMVQKFLPYREKLLGPVLVDRIDQTRKMWEGGKQFGPPWKYNIERAILDYMLLPTQPLSEAKEELDKVKKMYAKYERDEPLTLLELAVWKARRGSADLLVEEDEEEDGSSKRKLEETRITSGIDAIMEGVMPFLGLRKAESSNKRARADE